MNRIVRWWYLHSRLRWHAFGFCNPLWPAPPWTPIDDPRWQKLAPIGRRYNADYLRAGGADVDEMIQFEPSDTP